MSASTTPAVETDPRFPSGRWLGFFLDRRMPGRHEMELELTFRDGKLSGEGRDFVGEFLVRGHYQLEDGKCSWIKQYIGAHSIGYRGFNEGKGIWGTWELREFIWRATGGFQIWPEGMEKSASDHLHESTDLPMSFDGTEPIGSDELTPAESVSSR